ncbi:hypothetical protein [Enterococcus faecium]|uniref:hypothetical protein n=1 Tax=Enterococcus faecium TaxID=1352 RepID=UPI0023B2AB0F|nr:hypothetical protein [Enterococcus faecium]
MDVTYGTCLTVKEVHGELVTGDLQTILTNTVIIANKFGKYVVRKSELSDLDIPIKV